MINSLIYALMFATLLTFAGCGNNKATQTTTSSTGAPSYGKVPAALPDSGFKAQIEINNPPAKLRTGEKTSVEVRIKNASDVVWYARGAPINPNPGNQFYLAAGNRWLTSDGKLVTNMDGRYGLDRNLRPGEETTIPLQVTAPKDAGDYLLEVDVIQEQVGWFSDKGSPTAKAKISVVR